MLLRGLVAVLGQQLQIAQLGRQRGAQVVGEGSDQLIPLLLGLLHLLHLLFERGAHLVQALGHLGQLVGAAYRHLVIQLAAFQHPDALFQRFHVVQLFPHGPQHDADAQHKAQPELGGAHGFVHRKVKVAVGIQGGAAVGKFQRVGAQVGALIQRFGGLTVGAVILHVVQRGIVDDHAILLHPQDAAAGLVAVRVPVGDAPHLPAADAAFGYILLDEGAHGVGLGLQKIRVRVKALQHHPRDRLQAGVQQNGDGDRQQDGAQQLAPQAVPELFPEISQSDTPFPRRSG